jgi:hypothetical protein
MRRLRPIPLIGLLFLAASFCFIAGGSAAAQNAPARRLSPNALVADLYRAHSRKRGPFFQTRSRALLDKYFEKSLADLIWKDAVTAKGEVGALDGDPLYDAQDFDIKNFAIGKPVYADGKAKVVVTFQNFGKNKTIVFILVNGRAGWRIYDIDWSDGSTLRKILKGEEPKN